MYGQNARTPRGACSGADADCDDQHDLAEVEDASEVEPRICLDCGRRIDYTDDGCRCPDDPEHDDYD